MLGLLRVYRALVGILEDDLGLPVRIVTARRALLRFEACAVFDPFLVRGVLVGGGLVGGGLVGGGLVGGGPVVRSTVSVAAHALTVPMT
ncbi:MAG: hypothetical protein QOH56_218 [Pseudonocardiales bacterium]|nr:hypothetical protein [Pseudonocardiales bacterium]